MKIEILSQRGGNDNIRMEIFNLANEDEIEFTHGIRIWQLVEINSIDQGMRIAYISVELTCQYYNS